MYQRDTIGGPHPKALDMAWYAASLFDCEARENHIMSTIDILGCVDVAEQRGGVAIVTYVIGAHHTNAESL